MRFNVQMPARIMNLITGTAGDRSHRRINLIADTTTNCTIISTYGIALAASNRVERPIDTVEN